MEGMNTTAGPRPGTGLLDRSRTVAGPGFNRWLVPPAALAIHLCIGMAYGLSVFWLPMTRLVGLTQSRTCGPEAGLPQTLTVTGCDWRVSDVSWTFTIAIVALGSSAAIWGAWLERAGPRKAGVAAALCWCGGMLIGAVGVALHQLWMLWLGLGALGGIGLGIGYISPVSTLIKWFPDRRGMATGMAIMGFGGGALVGAPLADQLIGAFHTPASTGVAECLAAMAGIYLVFMLAGAFAYRVPPANWTPEGWAPPAGKANALITRRHVHLQDAHKTLSFWMIWAVLCLNVSAGIGVLALASPMLQEIFGGSLIGQPGTRFAVLDDGQRRAVAAVAAGFVGLLSLFNIGGRFAWASLSDRIGRKVTYGIFFALGILLYASAPWAAHAGSKALFVAMCCAILTMYGGGFATVPAYLADVFGTQFVGAIHGRLLTAWSTAGVVGPVLVTYIREAQIGAGVPRETAYDATLYVLAGLLAAGFVTNLLVRPLAERRFMPESSVAELQGGAAAAVAGKSFGMGRGGLDGRAALAWAAVGLPIVWGISITLQKTIVLFQ